MSFNGKDKNDQSGISNASTCSKLNEKVVLNKN